MGQIPKTRTMIVARFQGSLDPSQNMGFKFGQPYKLWVYLFTRMAPRVTPMIHITYDDTKRKEEVEVAYTCKGFFANWTDIRAINDPSLIYEWASLMPFGKYAGHKLITVPPEHLHFIWENQIPMPDGLFNFLVGEIGNIKQQLGLD